MQKKAVENLLVIHINNDGFTKERGFSPFECMLKKLCRQLHSDIFNSTFDLVIWICQVLRASILYPSRSFLAVCNLWNRFIYKKVTMILFLGNKISTLESNFIFEFRELKLLHFYRHANAAVIWVTLLYMQCDWESHALTSRTTRKRLSEYLCIFMLSQLKLLISRCKLEHFTIRTAEKLLDEIIPKNASMVKLNTYLHRSSISLNSFSRHKGHNLAPWQFRDGILVKYRLSPLQGIRIGEAQHPGPNQHTFDITFINPTSLWGKMDCIAQFHSHLFCFAETSATALVQKKLSSDFRKMGFKSIWGSPAPKQIQAYTDDSHRGAAVGVSNHSCYPIRTSCTDAQSDWEKAGRYMHSFVRLPNVEIQVITVYGFHSNLPSARQRTDKLLHFALEQMELTTHPVVICGDFNHHPSKLEAAKILKEKGFRTSEELFEEIEGGEMPFTYGQSTRNDVFFLSPWLASRVTQVKVDDRKIFAGHNPVSLQLQLPTVPATSQTWRMPKSWIIFEPDPQLIAKHYDKDPVKFPQLDSDTPDTLMTQWSIQVEIAVDRTIREQHQLQPERYPVDRLSRSYKGRAVPRKLIQTPLAQTIKTAWNGHYNPPTDGMNIGFRQRTKQLRRIQSLHQMVMKYHPYHIASTHIVQMQQEWFAILASTGFPRGFKSWIEDFPELEPISDDIPMPDELHNIIQLLRYQLDSEASQINHKNRRHAKYIHQQDLKQYHMQAAFRSIREPSPGLIRQVNAERSYKADKCQSDGSGLITLTLPEEATFDTRQNLQVDGNLATFIDWNPPELDVMLHNAEAELGPQPQVRQVNPTVDPTDIAQELAQYWEQFWNASEPFSNQNDMNWSSFQNFLKEVPVMQLCEIDMTSLALWKEAITSIRSKTATGVCGWNADELKTLPDCILCDLIKVFQCYTKKGFPAWFMQARVIPLAKKPHACEPKHSRPITILSLLYRVWSRVVTRQILRQWTDTFPQSITGFLPGRSPTKMLYELQFRLEALAHKQSAQQYGGVTLDLVKAFNLLPRIPCYRALIHFGLPREIVDQWFYSIQKMQRLWQIEMQLFPSRLPWVGFPEGDTWSIVCMLAICRVWDHHLTTHQVANNTFADNWSWFTEDPTRHVKATTITVDLIASLNMQIDWDKTWCWATSEDHKKALQQVRDELLPADTKFTRINCAKELGLIMHYKCTPFREPHKTRHRQTIARLRKIQKLTATIDRTEILGSVEN